MSDVPPYHESQIEVLNGLQAIRRRPNMYFGSDPINQIVLEALNIWFDAALRGTCHHITITLKPDAFITIEGDSEGIPVEIYQHLQTSLLELYFTTLFTGNPFGESRYPTVNGGLHGIGPQAVNAGSAWLSVENKRDGYIWFQSYERGYPQVPVTRGRALEPDENTGLTITFQPDLSIFSPTAPSFETSLLRERCREVAYMIAGLSITFRDERTSEVTEQTFYAPDGLRSWLNDQLSANPLHEPIYVNTDLYERYVVPRNRSDTSLRKVRRRCQYPFYAEIAIQFTSDASSIEIGYSNTVQTIHGGEHMAGLRSGLVAGLNRYFPAGQLPLRWKQLPSGLRTAVSIRHLHPQFESQTSIKLMNRDVRSPIKRAVIRAIDAFAAAHPDQMQRIIDHCIANRRSRTS